MGSVMDILVIHIGAGIHDQKLTHKYKSLLRNALSKHSLLESSKIIESSSLTNTGYGSSLNLLGKVECDASFIINNHNNKESRIGSLVNMNCKFPILELFHIFNNIDELYNYESDLSPPIMLSYPSLKNFINGEIIEDPNELISPKSQRIYNLYKDKVFKDKKLPRDGISDTIGLIHLQNNTTTIASSSGGNFLKLPGRIGCAGIIGASIAFNKSGIANISCMCSGNGEQIIRYKLAQLLVENISSYLEDNYGECIDKLLCGFPVPLYIGFIVVIETLERVQLLYGHTTESFHFGFRVAEDKTKVVMSYAEQKGKLTFGEYILT